MAISDLNHCFKNEASKTEIIKAHNNKVNSIYAASIYHTTTQIDFTTLTEKQFKAYKDLQAKAVKYLQSFEE